MPRLKKTKVASAFMDRDGVFKCAGPLSALPFNPHPYDRCPQFRVNFNKKWITVDLVEASDEFGWIAQAAPEWDGANTDVAPKINIRK